MHDWRSDFTVDSQTVYLNHGSFGPSPRTVQETFIDWTRQLESQPMDFFIRRMEPLLTEVRQRLAALVGAKPGQLALVDNATIGMNAIAASLPLAAGDEVLLTDHEYGAVDRIWRTRCAATEAGVVTCRLPLDGRAAMVDAIESSLTPRTRLLVVSHVTSPTALILPVADICRMAKQRGVPVCIDGPHALAMLPLNLSELDCDFYVASGHKWLSAPFGSGFLYAAGRQHSLLRSAITSWGRSLDGSQPHWTDEFHWLGTRNPAAWLSIPAAIDFLEQVGWDRFRQHSTDLIATARESLTRLPGIAPFTALDDSWFGSMLPLEIDAPDWPQPQKNRTDPLQAALWERHRIEVPCTRFQGRRLLRVSCHLYNSRDDIARLQAALEDLLPAT